MVFITHIGALVLGASIGFVFAGALTCARADDRARGR